MKYTVVSFHTNLNVWYCGNSINFIALELVEYQTGMRTNNLIPVFRELI